MKMHDRMAIPHIIISKTMEKVPEWAVLERKLIDLMNESVEVVLEKYVKPDGSMLWPVNDEYVGLDALDDAYESFHNWPIFYLAGGDSKFKDYSNKEFDAITRQFTKYDCGCGHPMIVNEYEQGYDWFHQGEGYLFFYMLSAADPQRRKTIERAIKLAGYYLNEHPGIQNYDPVHKIIKSSMPGSMGPDLWQERFSAFIPWEYADWKKHYGLPFQNIAGCDTLSGIHDSQAATNMGKEMSERMSRGDTLVNLASTTLAANAYLFTGEEKYKDWINEYVGAWIMRMEENGGIMPDNVGLNGEIGQYTQGKWYGAYYGWTWPHGWHTISAALLIASENRALLNCDTSCLDLVRSQMDMLISKGVTVDNTLYMPTKHGDPGWYGFGGGIMADGRRYDKTDCRDMLFKDGWFEFHPVETRCPARIWFMGLEEGDLERVKKIRNNDFNNWLNLYPAGGKDQAGNDLAWVAYMNGEFPDYPEKILINNITRVYDRLKFIREDDQDPATYADHYLQVRNTINMEGLVQLTMGAPLPVYNGGLLLTSVCHFDVLKNRPGLPEDVSALVSSISKTSLSIELVNLNMLESREMIIKSGVYGEHAFTTATHEVDGESIVCEINGKELWVTLAPGTAVKLTIGMNRYVNKPSL